MTDFNIVTAGHVYGRNATYSTARSTAYNHFFFFNSPNLAQSYDGTYYYVYRAALKFDTSSLSGETVSGVTLKMAITVDTSDQDFDVQIVKCDWSAYDPVGSGNRDAVFDLILSSTADNSIWRNTSGMSLNTYYESGALDPTWVNTSGYTYYGLRSSRDASATAPSLGVNEGIKIGDTSANYIPILSVTTGGAPPSSAPIHLIRTGMQPGMRIGL